jgi:uncharacterized protein (TIGR02246 family)
MNDFLNGLSRRSALIGTVIAVLATNLVVGSPGLSQPALSQLATPHGTEEACLRALLTQMNDGFNSGNGDAVAAAYAQDGELVSATGSHWSGQQNIAKYLTSLLTGPLKGWRYIATVDGIRFLRPDVVLINLQADYVPLGATEPAPERHAVHFIVAVRDADTWRVTLSQFTRSPLPSPNAAK